MQIHIAHVEFRSGHEPVPLKIVAQRQTAVESRLVVAEMMMSNEIVIIEIVGLAVAELPAGMQTNVKSGPITKCRSRRWRNHFTFFPTVSFCSGKRSCQSAAGQNHTH